MSDAVLRTSPRFFTWFSPRIPPFEEQIWVLSPFCWWEEPAGFQSRYMVRSELTLSSPNPPPPLPVLPDTFSSCSLSLESFLQIDSYHQFFSEPGTSRSRSWVRRTAAGAGSPPVLFLQGEGTRCRGGSRRILGARQPRFHISSLFIIHSSNKFQVWSCPQPYYVNVFGF